MKEIALPLLLSPVYSLQPLCLRAPSAHFRRHFTLVAINIYVLVVIGPDSCGFQGFSRKLADFVDKRDSIRSERPDPLWRRHEHLETISKVARDTLIVSGFRSVQSNLHRL